MCGVLGGFAKWLEQQLSDLGCVVREVDDIPGCVELIWDEDPEEDDDFDVSFLQADPNAPSQAQIEQEAWDMGRCLYHNVNLEEDEDGVFCAECDIEAWETAAEERELTRLEPKMGLCQFHGVPLEEDWNGEPYCPECFAEADWPESDVVLAEDDMIWTEGDYKLWDEAEAMRRQVEHGISHCRRCGLPLPQVRDEDGTHYGECPCRRSV